MFIPPIGMAAMSFAACADKAERSAATAVATSKDDWRFMEFSPARSKNASTSVARQDGPKRRVDEPFWSGLSNPMASVVHTTPNWSKPSPRAVGLWLFALAAIVLCMVTLGGLT